MDQYGFYIQDDWRPTDRLTVNAGLRYDLVTGFHIDQSGVPNFVKLTTAAAAGRFAGIPAMDEWGKEGSEDKNNWQPRIGAVYDLRGDGRDVIRAGWGIYYDYGFTNANILFPGLSAQGGSGVVFDVNNSAGIRNPDGSFFQVGQPISNIASQNGVNPNGPFFSTQRRGAADPPAVHQPDLGRLVTSDWHLDRVRRRLRPHQGNGPRRAVAAEHAHQSRRAPLGGPRPEPGQPDAQHEHR